MPDMERADDFSMQLLQQSFSANGIIATHPIAPRNCRLIKSMYRRRAAFDGSVDVKITSSKGDLADHLVSAVVGAAGDIDTVHHREESNNAFAAGTAIEINVVDGSAGVTMDLVLIFRPL